MVETCGSSLLISFLSEGADEVGSGNRGWRRFEGREESMKSSLRRKENEGRKENEV